VMWGVCSFCGTKDCGTEKYKSYKVNCITSEVTPPELLFLQTDLCKVRQIAQLKEELECFIETFEETNSSLHECIKENAQLQEELRTFRDTFESFK